MTAGNVFSNLESSALVRSVLHVCDLAPLKKLVYVNLRRVSTLDAIKTNCVCHTLSQRVSRHQQGGAA